MKYLKGYKIYEGKIADNIHYFENKDMKSIIEDTISNIKDICSKHEYDHGWIETSDTESPIFSYFPTRRHSHLNASNFNYYEAYKMNFYENNSQRDIKYDGEYYSNNIEFITKVMPEVHDSINKLKNMNNCDVSFVLSGNHISLLIYVPYE
jgi:hypothetical protein